MLLTITAADEAHIFNQQLLMQGQRLFRQSGQQDGIIVPKTLGIIVLARAVSIGKPGKVVSEFYSSRM